MKLFDFLVFTFTDFIDIVLVAVLLYYLYRLLRDTVAINIFLGIIIIYGIWKLTEALEMELLSNILGKFIGVGVFALIVVFQQEIRKFLLMIGSTKWHSRWGILKQFSFTRTKKFKVEINVETLVSACRKMAQQHTGALIILERDTSLDFVKTTGDKMNIEINQPILESIFYKNSPLHDGAIIIDGNYIVATRVVLPVVSQSIIPKRFGLRHRAATSITEKTDATAIVVSEETGQISYIRNGEFVFFNTDEELKNIIENDLN